jgi:hypothetical protein
VCSRRCAGLRKKSQQILQLEAEKWCSELVRRLRLLDRASTVCPGDLCVQVMPGVDKPLTLLRPLLFQMAQAGTLTLQQKGKIVPWWKIKGPFRVRGLK